MRTCAECARQASIVRSAIEVIANVGHGNASFARIAERAGPSSTGLIPYCFGTKANLVAPVVEHVHREFAAAGANPASA